MAESPTPITPVAGQGNEGDKKKIAGKFDTIEQAVEEGYMGLEKGFHNLSENVSKLTKIMETAMTTPVGTQGYTQDPYQRGGNQKLDDNDIDPSKFLLNPGEYLQKRDEKLAEKIVGTVVDLVGNLSAVNDFKSRNTDLVKHEKVVQAFMRDQDQRLPIRDRLENAGKAAREYLSSLKVDLNAGNPTTAPRGQNFVEAPSTGGLQPGVTTLKDEDAEGEKALTEYINERNRDMADHFGAIPKK